MRVRLCVRVAILAVGLACADIDEAVAATITAVQSTVASADTAGTSLAKAFSSATAAGNLLVVVVGFNSTLGTTWTCADSQGNAYAVASFTNDARHNRALGICYAMSKAGANTVTVSFPAAYTFRRLIIHEYKGADLLAPLDVSAGQIGTATTAANGVVSPAVVPQQHVELIFGAVADTSTSTTITAGTGFTKRKSTTTNDVMSEDLTQNTAASIAATFRFAAAHDYIAAVAAFRPAPDTAAPVVSVTSPASGSFVAGASNVTINANATDDTRVASVQFLVDGTALGTPDLTSPYSAVWAAPAVEGPHALSAIATDAFGNQTTSASNNVVVDVALPTGTVVINAGDARTKSRTATLTLTGADSLSPVTQMRFTNTGSSYSTAETFATTKTWTLSSGDGTKTVYAQVKDAAGQWSTAATDTIVLDTTAPTISAVASKNILPNSALITWTTNETSTSRVEYGPTTAYGLTTPLDNTPLTAHSVPLSGLLQQTLYNYRVRSIDAVGNERVGSNATFTTTGVDSTPPSIPGGLAASSISTSQISLSWNASTDNVGVTGYDVWRNSVQIATTTARTYADLGLQPGTTYSYNVNARDALGNTSALSSGASAVTKFLPDTTPPVVQVTAPSESAVVSQLDLAVGATAVDAVVAGQVTAGVVGVQFFVDATSLGAEDTTSPFEATWNTWLTSNGSHVVSARARDVAGNVATSAVTVQVSNPADVLPPSAPAILASTPVSWSKISVTWTASTDDIGVANYQVLRDGAPIGTTSATTFEDAGLAAATSYTYTVQAIDYGGNPSAPSEPSTAKTLNAPDTTAPTVPAGLSSTAPLYSVVNLAWEASSDPAGPAQDVSGMSGYRVYRNGQPVATVPGISFSDTGRLGSTTYTYTVAAIDVAGNISAPSLETAVTTPETPPDITPPAAITTLALKSCGGGSCTLTWTAPGDDGSTGTASGYDIRYATTPIGDELAWNAATQASGEPGPLAAGSPQNFVVTGLTPGPYFFVIKTSDLTGNISAISNTATITYQPVYTFAVYGDSRSGSCPDNSDHIAIVNKIVAANPAFVVHVGDMITGYQNTTNWIQRGGCPNAASTGSFQEIVAPLMNRPAPAGLPTSFFPTIGNHDDTWNDGWYPDAYNNGICDVFGAATLRALVPNHTRQDYFRDKTGRNLPILSDDNFYTGLCSKTDRTVYSNFLYYSFDYNNSHFVVMRINSDYYDLRASNTSCSAAAENNYDTCYNIHQLHWLQADLARAKANPAIKHIFGFLHAPVFTTADDHPATASWPWVAQEFSKVEGDIVFSGHDHIYERTVPIYSTAANPGGVRDDARGTVYAVTGGGGSPLHGFRASAWFDAERDGGKHFTKVTVDNDVITIVVTDINGAILDQFEVR